VTIPPTILTMEADWFCLSFLTRLLTRFLSLLSLDFPPNTFPKLLTKLTDFLKLFVLGGNTGGSGVVSICLIVGLFWVQTGSWVWFVVELEYP
jgi:hypothetical protein